MECVSVDKVCDCSQTLSLENHDLNFHNKGGKYIERDKITWPRGMGTVKAGEILVYAAVMEGKYGNSIPFLALKGKEHRWYPL